MADFYLYCNDLLCIADVLKACGYEWALVVLVGLGDIPPLSVSRFNRRLHEVGEWLPYLA
ncbi:MAG: hypothetical protein HND46_02195 [Chloroflexi bacterium]|nr:hypothetical protein [Chloroflexota bacterium]